MLQKKCIVDGSMASWLEKHRHDQWTKLDTFKVYSLYIVDTRRKLEQPSIESVDLSLANTFRQSSKRAAKIWWKRTRSQYPQPPSGIARLAQLPHFGLSWGQKSLSLKMSEPLGMVSGWFHTKKSPEKNPKNTHWTMMVSSKTMVWSKKRSNYRVVLWSPQPWPKGPFEGPLRVRKHVTRTQCHGLQCLGIPHGWQSKWCPRLQGSSPDEFGHRIRSWSNDSYNMITNIYVYVYIYMYISNMFIEN